MGVLIAAVINMLLVDIREKKRKVTEKPGGLFCR